MFLFNDADINRNDSINVQIRNVNCVRVAMIIFIRITERSKQ